MKCKCFRYLLIFCSICFFVGNVNAQRFANPAAIVKDCERKNPSPEAMAVMGDYCYNGNYDGVYVRKDWDKAIYWYRRAARHKSRPQPVAMRKLAKYYENQCANKELSYEDRTAEADSALVYRKMVAPYSAEDKCQLGVVYYEGWLTPCDYTKALQLFRQSADEGCISALLHIGMMMEFGMGLPRNVDSAAICYRQAYARNDISGDADYFMGHLLLNGIGCKPNWREAMNLFNKSIAKGSAWGNYGMGQIYEDGCSDETGGLESSFDIAEGYYKIAAEKGLREAQFKMGEMAMYKLDVFYSNTYDAGKYYLKAARHGHLEAALSIGLFGDVRFYRSVASACDDPRILYFLGAQYENGDFSDFEDANSISQNYDSALICYQKAVAGGSVAAAYRLGLLYEKGKKTIPDTLQALRYYKIALDNSYSSWAFWDLLEKWEGCPANHTLFDRLRKQVNTSNGTAAQMDSLGTCYLIGDGVGKDVVRAAECYRQAAAMGNANAMCNLAMLLRRSELHAADSTWPQNDYKMAITLYERAAALGSIRAMTELGIMNDFWADGRKIAPQLEYLKQAAQQGNGMAQDAYARKCISNDERMKWFLCAARQGIPNALFALGRATKLNRAPLKHAANQNIFYAYWVGNSYLGYGSNSDLKNAAKWYKKALEDKEVYYESEMSSAVELAYIYLSGRGGEKNERKALEVLTTAWEKAGREWKSSDLEYAMGQVYEFGLDTVKPDTAKACQCYRQMALSEAMSVLRNEALTRLKCKESNYDKASAIQIEWQGKLKDANRLQNNNFQNKIDVFTDQLNLCFTLKSDTSMLEPEVRINGREPLNKTTRLQGSNNQMESSADHREIRCNYSIEYIDTTQPINIQITARNVDGASKPFFLTLNYKTKRTALVVGTSSYRKRNDVLNCADNDARCIAEELRNSGYRVIECIDLPGRQLGDSIAKLRDDMEDCRTVLFFYAGHGFSTPDSNYAMLSYDYDTIFLTQVMDAMRSSSFGRTQRDKMIIIDACRSGSRITTLPNQGDFDILYSTLEGQTAHDGRKQGNSRFTASILYKLRNSTHLDFNMLGSYAKDKNREQQADYFLNKRGTSSIIK